MRKQRSRIEAEGDRDSAMSTGLCGVEFIQRCDPWAEVSRRAATRLVVQSPDDLVQSRF
jgi:hypothetical protein